MTETKVVVAAFDANANGFSNCELVIRTVPGHITQQAADPSHLPAEVLEHLVDWAFAGLEEQTPTTDTEPGPSLDEDRVRQIVRDEVNTYLSEDSLHTFIRDVVRLDPAAAADIYEVSLRQRRDSVDLVPPNESLQGLNRRADLGNDLGHAAAGGADLVDSVGEFAGDVHVTGQRPVEAEPGVAESHDDSSPSAGDAGAHSVEGDRPAPADMSERATALAAEFGYPLAEVNDFLLEILHLREQKTDDKTEPLLDGQAFPPVLLEARHRVPQLSGDPELGVEVTRTDLAERLGIGDLVEIFWLLVGHMSSPSTGEAGAHSVEGDRPAPSDEAERTGMGEVLLKHLANSRQLSISRRPASPDWLLETQLLLIRTVLATHTTGGREKLAEIDAELEVLRSRIAEEAAQTDVSAARAHARSTLGDLNSELSDGDPR